MESLSLFLSCKTAAALASMLLFTSCLHLSATLQREGEREEGRAVAERVIRAMELAAFLPLEGKTELLLPPLRDELLLKGRMESGIQIVEVWRGEELLLSSFLPFKVGPSTFSFPLPTLGRLLLVREENLLLLQMW